MNNHTPSQPKRLYRSTTNKKLAGVCGGLAAYLDADPTVIRLCWMLLTVFSGIVPGLIAYIIAAAIMPQEP